MELIDDRTNGGASFFVRTIENLPLSVDDESLENAREDRAGVLYSKSGLRLLKCSDKCIIEYKVWEGTKAICNFAFAEREDLIKIKLPESLVVIGEGAFKRCRSLTSTNLPNSVTTISAEAFYYCESLAELNIPDNVTSIENYAFYGCKSLTKLNIPDNVRTIGKHAFDSCTGLTDLRLPEGIISIGDEAFRRCDKIAKMVLPESLMEIDGNPFADSGITTIVNKSKHFKIEGNLLIQGDKIISVIGKPESIVVPNYITTIVPTAFGGCHNLRTLILSDGIKELKENTLFDCWNLNYIRMPRSLVMLKRTGIDTNHLYTVHVICHVDDERNAIEKRFKLLLPCELHDRILITEKISTKVTEEDLANSLEDGYGVLYSRDGRRLLKCKNFNLREYIVWPSTKVICDEAFDHCNRLAKIKLSDQLLYIGNASFRGCEGLNDIDILGNVIYIGEWAFAGSSLTTVTILPSVREIGSGAFCECPSLIKIDVAPGNKSFSSIDGVLYSFEGDTLKQYPGGSPSKYITIPQSVTNIGDYSFWGCENIMSVVINQPIHLGRVGEYAFGNCPLLEEVEINSPGGTICKGAFSDCGKLFSVSLPKYLREISEELFSGCTSLANVAIPETVSVIGDKAFYDCSGLKKISIPNSVKSISDYAFADCTELRALELPEGIVSIGNGAFFNCTCFGVVVQLPESVEYIGKEAFTNGYYVKLPHTIKRVEEKAFDYFFFKRVYVTYTYDKDSVDLNRIRDMFPDKLFWNVRPICEKLSIDEEQLYAEGRINAVQYHWLQEYRKIFEEYAPNWIIDWEMQIAYDMLLEYDEGDELSTPMETVEEWLF